MFGDRLGLTLPALPALDVVEILGRAGNVCLVCKSGLVPNEALRCCLNGPVEVRIRSFRAFAFPCCGVNFGEIEVLFFELDEFVGDFARFADSLNQFLKLASCSLIGCWYIFFFL